ncbi:MAG: hypothetical protein E2598_00930 [Sphingobium sp.]|nr:hypothetical protein [Sphingobium sp.]
MMKMMFNPMLSGALLACLIAAPAQAQETPAKGEKSVSAAPSYPPFQIIVADERYDYLSDADKRTSLWPSLKYIPITDGSYLSLGGEIRPRVEAREHMGFGRGAEDSGLNSQLRSRLWADLHVTPNVRIFAELQSAFTTGEDVAGPAVDQNPLEVQQAFVEFSTSPSSQGSLALRLGRQQIMMGKRRLIEPRGAPNYMRAYDAARLLGHSGKWRFGLMGGAPVRDELGTLNDSTNDDWTFIAGHVARKMDEILPGSDLELLYIHTNRKIAPMDRFVGKRETLSARFSGKNGGLDYDVELIGQHGKAQTGTGDQQKVRAWYVGTDSGYTFPVAWQPRLGLKVDIGSGDTNPNDNRMGSYDFLWSASMTWTPELGYTNLISAGPTLRVKPMSKLTVDLGSAGLWRTTLKDGLYNLSHRQIRSVAEGRSRYVGLRTTAKVEYQWNRWLLTGLYVNRTFAGDFLKETGDSKDMLHSALYTTFRF